MWFNIVFLANKLAKILLFDPILGLFIRLGQKQVTIETKNLKYDMIRIFPLIIGYCYMLQVWYKFKTV